ncbi:kinase-like domain-containing protein [Phascolomyces articulosus]|uniref:non-specific serine/threonine protein kinase n=1 Tax=Phascolomyces articulosus TaxID=60185 RepID=A0AAD5KKE0_9FUNG|nr:kinase-like domain-containing protein [Phascolomyces articulosus]
MQENDRRNVRRSSEAELQINRPDYISRVPLPLPYLPSDYEPSPTSPRHRFLTYPFATTVPMGRQRSRSTGHQNEPSLVPSLPPSLLSSSTPTTEHAGMLAIARPSLQNLPSNEIVPYREWTVISQNTANGQMVLYNREGRMVTVRRQIPNDDNSQGSSTSPIRVGPSSSGECPLCHRPFSRQNGTSEEDTHPQPDFMDRNYFRLLASTTPIQSPRTTQGQAATTLHENDIHLNANAFNEGYYEKFFVERKKLGRGFRGSVFLCEHELDGVKLGKYAVKKVAVGNNHPWLVKMLREVHLLERLRHPNIINYKHAWLEYNRLTPFGPEIPCLFILMECANGGNLEEYMEPEILPTSEKPSSSKDEKPKLAKQRKRERIKRQIQEHQQQDDTSNPNIHHSTQKRLLSMQEISSLFLDIVEGLAHLHQQNIVHRDLKPPNLLLKWDERKRSHDQPNEWRGAFQFPGIPRVLISDFGECEDLEGVPDMDRTGATGTLEFMAPEHVRLDPRGRHLKEYSPKADMWSLGMVLYYLCYTRLPYTNVDDIDLLQEEILALREVEFPKNRFDIYNNGQNAVDPAFIETMRQQNIPEQIPKNLQFLIQLLLSPEPEKRPSCQEILTQLRQMPQPLYMDESSFFGTDASGGSNSNGSSSSNGNCPSTSSSTTKMKKARRSSWRTQDGFFSPGIIKNESSMLDMGSKIQAIPPEEEEEEEEIRMESCSSSKGQEGVRSHHGHEEEKDTIMDSLMEEDLEQGEDDEMEEERGIGSSSSSSLSSSSRTVKRETSHESMHSKRRKKDTDISHSENELLISSTPDMTNTASIVEGFRSELIGIRTVKTVTAILKIATCTYPCNPYAPSPMILYPVVILAMLDFWSESVSHSLLLVALHVAWVVTMAILSGGICVA